MRVLLSKEEMKECDRVTIEEFGVPSPVLMERAAMACVDELRESGADTERVLVVCGSGNNGGDGLCIARLLFLDGVDVDVCFSGREASSTEETKLQRKICDAYGVNFCSNPQMCEYTVIVDALFGIGLSRNISGSYADIIRQINESPAFVLAVDIPSGIDADTGALRGCAVEADLTVTFAFGKPGLYLGEGKAHAGRTVVRQIGITSHSLKDAAKICTCLEPEDLCRLPGRPVNANKGSCGKLLLIAGSEGMCGAAIMAAKAAYVCGAGMVRIYTDACNRPVIQTALPEALVSCPDDDWEEGLLRYLSWADAVVAGPGLGMKEDKRKILTCLLAHGEKPLVLDADALNLVADNHMDISAYRGEAAVTPHPGEMSRLCGVPISEILSDLPFHAKKLARERGVVCVLKDAGTVISAGEKMTVNISGNSGMATAGSGDVLTGIIGCLAAQGMSMYQAAGFGVYLHGCAGDAAAEKKGRRSMLAGDIVDGLTDILRRQDS